jgi:hypothetical protein
MLNWHGLGGLINSIKCLIEENSNSIANPTKFKKIEDQGIKRYKVEI